MRKNTQFLIGYTQESLKELKSKIYDLPNQLKEKKLHQWQLNWIHRSHEIQIPV